MRHEVGHDMIARGEVDADEVRERIIEKYGKESYDAIAEMYAEAYAAAGIDMTDEEIWKEIICDSLGDMNIFTARAGQDIAAVQHLLNIKEETKVSKKPARAPPGEDGKTSRETDNFVEDKYFSRRIDRFDSLRSGGYITVGEINQGSPLDQIGIPAGTLYFDTSKIVKEMKDRKDVIPPETMKDIPKVLNNPIVITEFVDKNGIHSANVYGNLYIGSSPVVVGVMIATTQKGNVVSKIQTVHPNRNALREMTDDNILYLSKNKKETKSWFQSLGTQKLPLGGNKFGFIRSISQPTTKVNTNKGKTSREVEAKAFTEEEVYELLGQSERIAEEEQIS